MNRREARTFVIAVAPMRIGVVCESGVESSGCMRRGLSNVKSEFGI